MKMKYLVLGASRVGLRLLLAQSVLCASTVWAKPKILDGSVVGHWTFDDGSAYGRDTSGYEAAPFAFAADKMEGLPGTDASNFDNTGFLHVKKAGSTVTCSLGGGQSLNANTYYTFAARFKATGDTISEPSDDDQKELVRTLNDRSGAWHFGVKRYQKDAALNSSMKWMIATDPVANGFWDNKPRAEIGTKDGFLQAGEPLFPVAASGSTVTLGGKVGLSASYKSFEGYMDDVVVINRMLSKIEITRLCQTGETYIYPYGNPSFASYSGWSTDYCVTDVNKTWNPGVLIGAAYIMDGGKTLTQNATATFGGDVSKKISLTLGRLAPLKNVLTGETLVSNTQGNFSQGAGTVITFYDLRLNDGTYTAGGASLTTTLLDVDAPASKPFTLAAAGAFMLNVSEDTTGSGVLKKTGVGKITVSKWTGTAKLRLAEGSIKTPRLDGYTGGMVLVSKGSTVAFTGDDVLPTAANKMKIAFDGEKPTAKTAVMTVPAGVTAAMVQDVTQYDGGKVGDVTVENGVVYVEPGYPEDKGANPVLIWE